MRMAVSARVYSMCDQSRHAPSKGVSRCSVKDDPKERRGEQFIDQGKKKNVSIKCIDHRQTVTHSDAWILTGYNGSLEGTCLFLLRSQHYGAQRTLQQTRCHDLELLCGFTLPVCFRGWAWFSWRAGAPVSHTCNASNQQLPA